MMQHRMHPVLMLFLALSACGSTQRAQERNVAETRLEEPDTSETQETLEEPAMQWTWEDYEVVGYRTVTREQLLEGVPFARGTQAMVNDPGTAEAIKAWCDERKAALGVYKLRCSWVRFGDGKTYITAQVLEESDAIRLADRDEPIRDLALPAELDALMQQREERFEELFDSGQYEKLAERVIEDDAGRVYLEYHGDDQLGALSKKLADLAPTHRDVILDVLKNSSHAQARARAANALNWAGQYEDSIRSVHTLLDDPSGLVRNDITRFMLAYVKRIEDPELKGSLVRVLALQAMRPSHADRNKALFGMLFIAQTSTEARDVVLEQAGDTIRLIAEQSILENVGGIAKMILAL